MTVRLDLPPDLEAALGPDPQRSVLESVLLQLVHSDVVSLARAAEVLGLSREEAVRWYTAHGYYYPDYTAEEWADELAAIRDQRR